MPCARKNPALRGAIPSSEPPNRRNRQTVWNLALNVNKQSRRPPRSGNPKVHRRDGPQFICSLGTTLPPSTCASHVRGRSNRLKLLRRVTATRPTNPDPSNKNPSGSGVGTTCLGSGANAGSRPASHPPPKTISVQVPLEKQLP